MDSIDSGFQSLAISFRAFHTIRDKVTAYFVVLVRALNTRLCQDASDEWKTGGLQKLLGVDLGDKWFCTPPSVSCPLALSSRQTGSPRAAVVRFGFVAQGALLFLALRVHRVAAATFVGVWARLCVSAGAAYLRRVVVARQNGGSPAALLCTAAHCSVAVGPRLRAAGLGGVDTGEDILAHLAAYRLVGVVARFRGTANLRHDRIGTNSRHPQSKQCAAHLPVLSADGDPPHDGCSRSAHRTQDRKPAGPVPAQQGRLPRLLQSPLATPHSGAACHTCST